MINSPLTKYGIVKRRKKTTKASELFESILGDFTKIKYDKPSEYIKYCWSLFQKTYTKETTQNNSLNGNFFELILATLFYLEKITPVFCQAKAIFVPNVEFDFLVYSDSYGPISISAKTSLRERYKQADLEGIALKYVHRNAKNYLLTLDEPAAINVQNKISQNAVLGLDSAVLCSSTDFDDFIKMLSQLTLIKPGKVNIITSSHIIEQL